MLESLSNRLIGKVMILGVGNPIRGDDGAGPYLIKQLMGKVDAALLDCEEVPENFLGKITESRPDTILIIDAIDLGMSPGTVALLEDIENMSYSTHHPSLQLFIDWVKKETMADVLILGIQPKSTDFGSETSDQVKETLSLLEHIILRSLALRLPRSEGIDIPHS